MNEHYAMQLQINYFFTVTLVANPLDHNAFLVKIGRGA